MAGSEGGARGFAKTKEEVIAWVKRRLGHGIVDVELTDDHYEDAIDNTCRWFSHRVGVRQFFQITIVPGETEYILPEYVVDVLDVWLPSDPIGYTQFGQDDASLAHGLLFGAWYGGQGNSNYATSPYPYSDLLMRLQYLETIRRITSESDWDYFQDERKLIISPAVSTSAGSQILTRIWTTKVDPQCITDPQEVEWFLRWALADAKEMLGVIRAKFDSMPSVGGDVTLQGDRLLDDAGLEKDTIKQEIINRRRSVPIVSG